MIWNWMKSQLSYSYNWLVSIFSLKAAPKIEQTVHYANKDKIDTYTIEQSATLKKVPRNYEFNPLGLRTKKGAASELEIAILVSNNHRGKPTNPIMASRYGLADQLWSLETNDPKFQELGPNTQAAIVQAHNHDTDAQNYRGSANSSAANSPLVINKIRNNILQALDKDQITSKSTPRP